MRRLCGCLLLTGWLTVAGVLPAQPPQPPQPPGTTAAPAPPDDTYAAWSAAFSPDGRLVAVVTGSAEKPGTLTLWDLSTGKTRVHVKEKKGIRCVAFAPDGKTLAAGSSDKTVALYDVAGKLQKILPGHTGSINAVSFSADGKLLASAGLDNTIKIWDLATGRVHVTLKGHTDWVLSTAFFPDGKMVASAGKDGSVKLWDIATGEERANFVGHLSPVECVAVSPDGKTVASGSWDKTAKLWDVATGNDRALLEGHTFGVLGVAFSPDGRTVATASGDWNQQAGGEVKLWDAATGEERRTMKGHANSIWCVRFSPDGRTLLSASRDKTVRLWEAATGQERLALPADGTVVKVAVVPSEPAALWNELASNDAVRAYRARWALAGMPEAVALLKQHLRPAPEPDPQQQTRLAEWIAKLDHDNFAIREKATTELAKFGPAAEPPLRKILAGDPSAELRQRVEKLLERVRGTLPTPEQLRVIRSLEVLEQIGSPEAKNVLERLAHGSAEAEVTHQAKASLARLAGR